MRPPTTLPASDPLPRPAILAAHVFLLFALAVAQPLYDILGRHAELFVARRTPPAQVWLLVAVLSLVLPGLLAALVVALGGLGRRIQLAAMLGCVAGLGAVTALPVAKRALGGVPATLGAATAIGLGVAVAYRRWPRFRELLTFFSPAALVFPLVFVAFTPVSRVVFPGRAGVLDASELGWGEVPVVVVLFDMVAVSSLLDERGEIDAVRYPAFGRLAAGATWFRQATTVARETSLAVPALLTGRSTTKGILPVFEEYPQNLFTLLGPRARTRAFESMTWMCPPEVCADSEAQTPPAAADLFRDVRIVLLHVLLPEGLTRGLPAVDGQWYGFGSTGATAAVELPPGLSEEERDRRRNQVRRLRKEVGREDRAAKLERFLAALPSGPGRSFSYLHLNLPHAPFEYLPSGRRYVEPDDPAANVFGALGRMAGSGESVWAASPIEVEVSYRRYLLQLGYADKVLGQILDRLAELALLEPALLVVAADHGQTFVAGQGMRDLADGDTRHIPLFVKLPGQRHGRIDDRPADLRDVLPTLAGVLGIELPWAVEGRALLDREAIARATAAGEVDPAPGRLPAEAWSPRLLAAWRRKLDRVGSGEIRRVYAAGPRPELIGRRLRRLVRDGILELGKPAKGLGYTLLHSRDLTRLRPSRPHYRPAYLIGTLGVRRGPPPPGVLLVLDGKVWATARTYRDGKWVHFLFLVPEEALERDRHRWKVMAMDDVDGSGPIGVAEVAPNRD